MAEKIFLIKITEKDIKKKIIKWVDYESAEISTKVAISNPDLFDFMNNHLDKIIKENIFCENYQEYDDEEDVYKEGMGEPELINFPCFFVNFLESKYKEKKIPFPKVDYLRIINLYREIKDPASKEILLKDVAFDLETCNKEFFHWISLHAKKETFYAPYLIETTLLAFRLIQEQGKVMPSRQSLEPEFCV